MLVTAAWTPPPPIFPEDNPPSAARIELGRRLFHDKRLSPDGTYACATCHQPARAFSDGRPVAVGATGERHARNTPSLANVAYRPALTWAEPRLRRLEEQLLTPLLGRHPLEMGGTEESVLAMLRGDPDYPTRFEAAYGKITLANVAKAIASFERTLISFAARWDRGDMSPSARRGEALFFSARTNCFQCHPAPHFTDTSASADLPFDEINFHNIGLYDLDGRGAYPEGNRGLFERTGAPTDMGRFRAPSLRNVAVTAPYMHDGSIATLDEVIEHYAAGGRGAGVRSPLKSTYVRGVTLSEGDKRDLVAFLESLTDEAFLNDPRFADPFAPSR